MFGVTSYDLLNFYLFKSIAVIWMKRPNDFCFADLCYNLLLLLVENISLSTLLPFTYYQEKSIFVVTLIGDFPKLDCDTYYICTTSIQRHKWLQTKMYRNSDTVFWYSISCPLTWCNSILFAVLAPETTLWNYLVTNQKLYSIKLVFKANTPSKMDHAMWKGVKIKPENSVGSCVHFLFEVI